MRRTRERLPMLGMGRRFGALAQARRALLVEAAGYLLLSRAALTVFPFRRVAARLGMLLEPSAVLLEPEPGPEQARLATEIGWAVACAARYVPFKAVCLPQAIAAKLMLERRGVASSLHLGAALHSRSGKAFEAHAWLDAVGVEVAGYPMAREFVEIARFV